MQGSEPVTRSDLGELVADRLRERVLSGDLPPGHRLVETTIAHELGTSRGPVRDAIARLEVGGLVRVSPRRGASVVRLDASDVEEIYSLRIALEELAVRRAVDAGSNSDWEAMSLALDDLEIALDRGVQTEAARADLRFHRAIVAAARHRRLLRAWDAFAEQTLLILRQLADADPSIQSSSGGHRTLLDAIVGGDRVLASALLGDHLRAARDALVASFRDGGTAR